MSLYDNVMKNVTVTLKEPDPNRPKLIQIDEHRYYFENRPNVIFNTSMITPNWEQCVKNAAYHMFTALLKVECEKRGIKYEDLML